MIGGIKSFMFYEKVYELGNINLSYLKCDLSTQTVIVTHRVCVTINKIFVVRISDKYTKV